MIKTISIKEDFTMTPGGRDRASGAFSAEEFRDDILIPELKKNYDKTIIDLDGVAGYANSFLEEVFGGLARRLTAGIVINLLFCQQLSIVSKEFELEIENIKQFILEEKNRQEEECLTVLVDDDRNYGTDIIIRNYKSALKILTNYPELTKNYYLMIDYDLNSGSKNGLTLLECLEAWGTMPKTINIVSSLPQGIKYMSEYLLEIGYIKIAGTFWRKKNES